MCHRSRYRVCRVQGRISKGETDVVTDVNRCLRYAQETCNIPLQYKPITGKVAVCTWADGSWANRICGKSQGAYLTAHVDEDFLAGTFGHVSECSNGCIQEATTSGTLFHRYGGAVRGSRA